MTAKPTNAGSFSQVRGVNRFTTHLTMGDVYFANSANSSASASGGYCVDAPSLTIAQAQALCNTPTFLTTYNDTVFIGAGHAETIVGAAGMTFSTPGVSYVGLGNGRLRPKITFSTSTAAQMLVTGQGISFSNIVFDFTGIDAIVAAILISSADVAFDSCDFICNSATAGVVKGILSAATADRLKITNCRFLGALTNSGTTTTAQLDHEVGADYIISGNYFVGKMTQAVLNAATILRGQITGNFFNVGTGTSAITMAAGSTPFIANNKINVASGTTPVTAAAGFIGGGNTYSAAAGVTSGAAITW